MAADEDRLSSVVAGSAGGPDTDRELPYSLSVRPLPGELPYSVASRYRERLGIRSAVLMGELFGMYGPSLTVTLPRNLARFTRRMYGSDADVDAVLAGQTSYPYLVSFLGPEGRERLRAMSLEGMHKGGIRRGLLGSSVVRVLLFCPECTIADVGQTGQAGWRREHQIQGVTICPDHDVGLRLSDVPTRTRHLLCCPTTPDDGVALERVLDDGVARSIACDTARLLERPLELGSRLELSGAMRSLILRSGWSYGKGRVSAGLADHVLDRIGFSPLLWGVIPRREVMEQITRTWLDHVDTPPLGFAHLAVLAVLGLSATDLEVELSGKSTGDEVGPHDRDGAEWLVSKTKRCRRIVADVMARMPDASCREIAALEGEAMVHLARYDRPWLGEVFKRRSGTRVRPAIVPGVTDRTLAARVPETVRLLMGGEGRPVRLSFKTIAEALASADYIRSHREKLPLTIAALRLHAEDPCSSTIRKVEWLVRDRVSKRASLRSNDLVIRRHRLTTWGNALVKAVAKALLSESPESYIEEALPKLRHLIPDDGRTRLTAQED